jgi:acylphosphatase
VTGPGGAAVRTHVFVSGRVQGVFFRDHVQSMATELGVGGWVRNLPDGRVEAEFEGAADLVERMVRWCATGPPRARVTRVQSAPRAPVGETVFRVR